MISVKMNETDCKRFVVHSEERRTLSIIRRDRALSDSLKFCLLGLEFGR